MSILKKRVDHLTMATMFIRALLLNTNPKTNKEHEKSRCPAIMWEDFVSFDHEIIKDYCKQSALKDKTHDTTKIHVSRKSGR